MSDESECEGVHGGAVDLEKKRGGDLSCVV